MFKLGNDKYFDRIKEAVRSQDMTLRANAVVLLGSSKKKDVLELLYWAKDDQQSDDKVRYQAAEGIAKLGDETIFPKLWTMVISAYPDVRVMGLSSMGALGTRKAQDVLLTKLDDEVVEVRLVAAEQLGLLKDSTGVPEVRGVFEQNLTLNMDQESRSRVLILTAMAIGNIKDNQLKGYLPALLEDKNPFVKIAASKAIFASLK
jgi:HEAT repeat protein